MLKLLEFISDVPFDNYMMFNKFYLWFIWSALVSAGMLSIMHFIMLCLNILTFLKNVLLQQIFGQQLQNQVNKIYQYAYLMKKKKTKKN